jgi:hypothetical protein
MNALDLVTPASVPILVAMFAGLWRLAVIYRVTSTGYVYRTKGRWGYTEIRPARSEEDLQTSKAEQPRSVS